MQLGKFSVSLAVRDVAVSRAFYEKLGFNAIMGDEKDNWLIMNNGTSTIGLFHGMFDKNILTFNPGWDDHGNPVSDFTDARALQAQLEQQGVEFVTKVDASSEGPISFTISDPDGNHILIDQHV